MSSNSVPFVAVTSSVWGRASFGGGLSPVFQDDSLAGLFARGGKYKLKLVEIKS